MVGNLAKCGKAQKLDNLNFRHTMEKLGISLSQHGSAKPMVSPRNGSGGFNEI